DSYIVFYERLKDEIRGGKSPRVAVQPAFKGAWHTIIAADIVTLLAAGVLYAVAISSVRGFALTLGIAVLLDMFVVYFYKRPVVFLMARGERSAKWLGMGLGRDQNEASPPRTRRRTAGSVVEGEAGA
ncbi:MAG: MMPL family transporter, partial [Actinomycetota bacterium]